ncbi:MAG: ribosome silencing factor [Blastochloris sp.]|nr:ribosome silencing factor [Blastochloris sp.]
MPPSKKNEDLKTVKACAGFALDKKAEEVVILDLRDLNGPALFFMICSGSSEPQIKAIANSIIEGMREKHQMGPFGYEGRSASQWIILDYGVVLVHILHTDKRQFYRIEDLWSDAKRIKVA